MSSDLENIKSEFIVDQEKYDVDTVPDQVRKIIKYARVGKEGKVFLEHRDLSPDFKLKVVMVSRFLANKLQSDINPTVSIDELSVFSSIDKDQVRARMSKIVKEKFAKRDAKGVFSVLSFRVKTFIDELED